MRFFLWKLKMRFCAWRATRRVKRMLKHQFIPMSKGEQLDNWGVLFGASRRPGETDEDFRKRLYKIAVGNGRK